MRKWVLAGALWAVAASPASAANLVSYDFSATGPGCYGACFLPTAFSRSTLTYAANFSLDPALVTRSAGGGSYFSYNGPDGVGAPVSMSAISSGDELYFQYSSRYMSAATYYTASLRFAEGTLGTGFPAAIDFSNVVGGSLRVIEEYDFVSGRVVADFFGTITSVSVRSRLSSLPSGGAYVTDSSGVPPVPEPTTWALMLFGFGAVGWSLRRNRQAVRAFGF